MIGHFDEGTSSLASSVSVKKYRCNAQGQTAQRDCKWYSINNGILPQSESLSPTIETSRYAYNLTV